MGLLTLVQSFRLDKLFLLNSQCVSTKIGNGYWDLNLLPVLPIFLWGILRKDFCILVSLNLWWRFLDDIFMIWLHGEEELNDFLARLNSFHENIKFTWEIDLQEIAFLDVWITKVKLMCILSLLMRISI